MSKTPDAQEQSLLEQDADAQEESLLEQDTEAMEEGSPASPQDDCAPRVVSG